MIFHNHRYGGGILYMNVVLVSLALAGLLYGDVKGYILVVV